MNVRSWAAEILREIASIRRFMSRDGDPGLCLGPVEIDGRRTCLRLRSHIAIAFGVLSARLTSLSSLTSALRRDA